MKALLLNPTMVSGWIPNVFIPIGLCYLKACLLKEGLKEVKVVDMGGSNVESIREIIHTESPEIVGITTFTDTRINALKAVAIAKEINPQVKTILGGVHATVMYQQIMENYPDVDIICRGESEITIVELFQALNNADDLHKVKGIVYRQDGKVVVNEGREKIRDLDILPFPNYDDFDLKKYKDMSGDWKGKPVGSIITSRGCPFSCTYCSSHSVWGNWRHRSISNVLDEIEWLVSEHGYEVFTFFDDIFTVNKARTEELCQGILNRGLHIKWRAQTRADCVSLEMLGLMRDAGCQSLVFGVESGSPTILKNLNKKEKIEDVVNAFAWCKKVGIRNQFNVLIGSPGETRATIEETRNLIKKTRPTYVSTSNLRVYPGTALWEQAQDEGLSDANFFLTDKECLYYTGAMSISEMFQTTRDYLFLQARLNGLQGYVALAKFGFENLRRTPKKVALGLLPWKRRSFKNA